jgi:hypothetical protein
VDIRLVSDDVVEVTSALERTVRNKSSYPERIEARLDTDEWGFAERASQILECHIEIDGRQIPCGQPTRESHSVLARTEYQQLSPDQTARLRYKWIEYKRTNDQLNYHFAYPTLNPEIEVRVPESLDWLCGFGTPGQIEEYRYAPRKRFRATYFPHQTMTVRWWGK